MAKTELQYRPGQIPFVWVVRREHGVNIYFDENNARKCFDEEYHKLRSKGYKFIGGESGVLTYAVFKAPNGERVYISVDDLTISDYKTF